MERTVVRALEEEFDRQVETLVRRGYPKAARIGAKDFRAQMEPLRAVLGDLAAPEERADRVPFAIVVNNDLVAREKAMPLVELKAKTGFTTMEADDLERFEPIDGVEIPGGIAYLIEDVDTGRATLNVTPDDAMKRIKGDGRSPLTVDEGIALVTHHPEILRTGNCFSMLGSRCGDRRVTALWISGGRPRLGWCWAGNPHTWLGSASCARRTLI